MEETTIEGSEITVDAATSSRVYIAQDDDVVIVNDDDADEFIAAVRKHTRPVEEPEPPIEKWYVVLKNSNYVLNNRKGVPVIFTDYDSAKRYGVQHGKVTDRWYLPMSVDHYERVFGR